MNVAFDPWIPVVTLDGEPRLASLQDVFTKGDRFSDISVRPHERVALMRLFLCIAHAALAGPKDYDEWCEAPTMLSDKVEKYLNKWKDSFDLFHPKRPWLQVADLKPIEPKNKTSADNAKQWAPLTKLCLTRSSGNNSNFFNHESIDNEPIKFSPNEIALNLLAFQNFFVAGGKASARRWGKSLMNNPPNPKGGPCSGKSILFSFLRGKSLLESLILNLNTFEHLELIYGKEEGWLGKPLWEKPIKSLEDNASILNATQTHLGRLVPQTRILRINEDCLRVLLGAGFDYPKFQDDKLPFHPDIFATVVTTESEERSLLSARPNKAFWRELHAVLVRKKSFERSARGPLCLENIPETKSCDIIINTMVTDPEKAADILDLLESVFHIPSQLNSEERIIVYKSEVKMAELTAQCLRKAIESYRIEIDGRWERRLKNAGPKGTKLKTLLCFKALTYYWTTIEKNLTLLMAYIEAGGTEDIYATRKAWHRLIFNAARDAYRTTCGSETPRQIKAFSYGWSKLTFQNFDTNTSKTTTSKEVAV
jgi:CRISPR system Cascade subunit CasA